MHIVEESLFMPTAEDVVNAVLGEKTGKQIFLIHLLNNAVSDMIEEISSDVK